MSKSVLIMDTPESCTECMFCFALEAEDAFCSITNHEEDPSMCKELAPMDKYWEERPIWCPLKEFPNKSDDYCEDSLELGVKIGWNNCLKEITGE